MPEAVIFVGIQASGKSTYFKEHYADTHVRINRDMLKKEQKEDILLHACLAAGQSFVVDNTNPTKEKRARYVALAKAAGFEVACVYFDIDRKAAEERNKTRKNKVPTVAIRGTAKKMEPPTIAEGFERVHTVTEDD